MFLIKIFMFFYKKLLTYFGTMHAQICLKNRNITSNVFVKISSSKSLVVKISKNCKINNGEIFNPIRRQKKCIFIISGNLKIGKNFGMSSSTIVCRNEIIIGDNVKIGGNVCIYDTDFHSLNYLDRRDSKLDNLNTNNKSIKIGNDVFIGAHSLILKGVTIGDRVIIGAGSVVTKNIPVGEIWGGNPVQYIRSI